MACPVCGGPIDYDETALANVCLQCGFVTSESLVVLGRVLEGQDGEAGRVHLHEGIRSAINPRFGTEQKEQYNSSRLTVIELFIKSVLLHFGFEGLISRAKSLFLVSKEKLPFRWGKPAKVIALACIYIASGEREKSLRVEDLSSITEISSAHIRRAQYSIVKALGIAPNKLDPSTLIEPLLIHLSKLISSSPTPALSGYNKSNVWSPAMLNILRSLQWNRVRDMADGVLRVASEISLYDNRIPEQVVVAAVVVGIEGCIKRPLPNSGELHAELAHFLGVGSTFGTAERYRDFHRMLEDAIKKITWIPQGKGKPKKADVARCIEDVVKHHQLVMNKPSIVLDTQWDTIESEEEEPFAALIDPFAPPDTIKRRSISPSTSFNNDMNSDKKSKRPAEYMRVRPGPAKRIKSVEMVTAQLAETLQKQDIGKIPVIQEENTDEVGHFQLHDPKVIQFRQQLLAGNSVRGLLEGETVDTDSQPTRLNRLLLVKKVDEISDSELFDDGELESLLRDPDEVEDLKRLPEVQEMTRISDARMQKMLNKKPSVPRKKREDSEPIPKRSKVDATMKANISKMIGSNTESISTWDQEDLFSLHLGVDEARIKEYYNQNQQPELIEQEEPIGEEEQMMTKYRVLLSGEDPEDWS